MCEYIKLYTFRMSIGMYLWRESERKLTNSVSSFGHTFHLCFAFSVSCTVYLPVGKRERVQTKKRTHKKRNVKFYCRGANYGTEKILLRLLTFTSICLWEVEIFFAACCISYRIISTREKTAAMRQQWRITEKYSEKGMKLKILYSCFIPI